MPLDKSMFLPQFSTSDKEAKLAHYSCFLQTVSPYFRFKIDCGIPRVRVDGTQEDYLKIVKCLEKISEVWPEEATVGS